MKERSCLPRAQREQLSKWLRRLVEEVDFIVDWGDVGQRQRWLLESEGGHLTPQRTRIFLGGVCFMCFGADCARVKQCFLLVPFRCLSYRTIPWLAVKHSPRRAAATCNRNSLPHRYRVSLDSNGTNDERPFAQKSNCGRKPSANTKGQPATPSVWGLSSTQWATESFHKTLVGTTLHVRVPFVWCLWMECKKSRSAGAKNANHKVVWLENGNFHGLLSYIYKIIVWKWM